MPAAPMSISRFVTVSQGAALFFVLSGMNTPVKTYRNNYEASEAFWTAARVQGVFPLIFMLMLIKYIDNKKEKRSKQEKNPFNDSKKNKEYFASLPKKPPYDRTGGFIKRKNIAVIAKLIGYKENTVRINLGKLAKLGFITKTKTGYRQKSITKIAAMLVVHLTKLRIKAPTKQLLKEKHAFKVISRVKKSQEKYQAESIFKSSATISGGTLAHKLGFRSASTGIKREKELEAKGKLVIVRHDVVKTLSVVSHDDNITLIEWKRDCNNLFPIKQVR